MNSRLAKCVATLAVAALIAGAALAVAPKKGPPPKRARPPKWSADVESAFFPDARAKLVGARPDYNKVATVASTANVPKSDGTQITDANSGTGWSKLIDSETIETEIKRLAQVVAQDVVTPAPFKGGGYKDCRRHFSVLAALFAVAAEYDGEVRWKDGAASLRDLFARAGRNCKVGTDQTFQEAVQRKQDLADLVGGNRPIASDAERKPIGARSPTARR